MKKKQEVTPKKEKKKEEAEFIPVDPSSTETINMKDTEEPSTEEKMLKKHEELENEISSLKDSYLRKQAELENFRKRVAKEKEEIVIFANKQLMEEFINLMDDFERAMQASEKTKDFEQFFSGVSMIHDSFLSSMSSKFGLESFGKEGDSFNPEKHEAITMETKENIEEPKVDDVFQKGYSLKGRVIRPAKVKVVQS